MKKMTRLVVALAAFALVLAACGDDSGSGEFDLVTEDTLTVCTDSPYPPMEYEEDGEFTGFDIEVMEAVAEELGLGGIEVNNTGFDPITSGLALEAGDCDIAAASITINDEREENIDFSDPYFVANQSLLVANGAPTALADFADSSLAVQTGTTGEMYANENAPEGTDIQSFENPGDVFTALEAGNVQGVLQDIVPNAAYALDHDNVTLAEEFETNEEYGFAVKEEGAETLLESVNEALGVIRDNGTYDDLYAKYFN